MVLPAKVFAQLDAHDTRYPRNAGGQTNPHQIILPRLRHLPSSVIALLQRLSLPLSPQRRLLLAVALVLVVYSLVAALYSAAKSAGTFQRKP